MRMQIFNEKLVKKTGNLVKVSVAGLLIAGTLTGCVPIRDLNKKNNKQ